MDETLVRSYGSQVKERLRAAIISGELAPGERINEVKLSSAYGISRTPLREAVTALAAEGWIEQRPHHGSRVATFAPDQISELLQVRWILETGALRLIFDREDYSVVADRLISAAERSGRSLEERAFELDEKSDFHLCLLFEGGNSVLYDLGLTVHAKLRAVRFRSGIGDDRRAAAIAEHQDIVNAIREKEYHVAKSALQNHLVSAAKGIERKTTTNHD